MPDSITLWKMEQRANEPKPAIEELHNKAVDSFPTVTDQKMTDQEACCAYLEMVSNPLASELTEPLNPTGAFFCKGDLLLTALKRGIQSSKAISFHSMEPLSGTELYGDVLLYALNHTDESVRMVASYFISHAPVEMQFDLFMRAAHDESSRVATSPFGLKNKKIDSAVVASVLEKISEPDAFSSSVKAASTEALKAMGHDEGVKLAKKLLTEELDPIARARTAAYLPEIAGDADSYMELLQIALADPDAEVRATAVRRIGLVKLDADSHRKIMDMIFESDAEKAFLGNIDYLVSSILSSAFEISEEYGDEVALAILNNPAVDSQAALNALDYFAHRYGRHVSQNYFIKGSYALAAITHPAGEVRLRALQLAVAELALSERGDVDKIVEIALDDPNPELASLAAKWIRANNFELHKKALEKGFYKEVLQNMFNMDVEHCCLYNDISEDMFEDLLDLYEDYLEESGNGWRAMRVFHEEVGNSIWTNCQVERFSPKSRELYEMLKDASE